ARFLLWKRRHQSFARAMEGQHRDPLSQKPGRDVIPPLGPYPRPLHRVRVPKELESARPNSRKVHPGHARRRAGRIEAVVRGPLAESPSNPATSYRPLSPENVFIDSNRVFYHETCRKPFFDFRPPGLTEHISKVGIVDQPQHRLRKLACAR